MEIAINIIPGQRYTVWSASITYNGTVVNSGGEFVGVDGVTTYTGSGYASEIIQMQSASIEAYVLEDIVFPEQLTIQSAALEITQSVNGTIYPEQLTIYNASLEVGGVVMQDGAKIIFAMN